MGQLMLLSSRGGGRGVWSPNSQGGGGSRPPYLLHLPARSARKLVSLFSSKCWPPKKLSCKVIIWVDPPTPKPGDRGGGRGSAADGGSVHGGPRVLTSHFLVVRESLASHLRVFCEPGRNQPRWAVGFAKGVLCTTSSIILSCLPAT